MTFAQIQSLYLPAFETELKKSVEFLINDQRQIIIDAIRYSVTAPGKRIRPLLCMMTEKSLTSEINLSLTIGVAIELIHCYSLIHDDLPAMDNDDFRRGRPTCHKAFGEDMAILAGDILNTYAFEYLTRELSPKLSADIVLELVQHFAHSCGIYGMAGGQALDLSSTQSNTQTVKNVSDIHHLKTGKLFSACFLMVAKATHQPPKIIDLLTKISDQFGLLFQIIDDILDATGNLESIGKSPGKDLKQNKLTYVSMFGLDGAKEKALAHKNEGLNLIQQLPFNSTDIGDIFNYVYGKGVAK
jgi:geranylgeranyl diphosphate synthase type II